LMFLQAADSDSYIFPEFAAILGDAASRI
jgi:hypothetical protein